MKKDRLKTGTQWGVGRAVDSAGAHVQWQYLAAAVAGSTLACNHLLHVTPHSVSLPHFTLSCTLKAKSPKKNNLKKKQQQKKNCNTLTNGKNIFFNYLRKLSDRFKSWIYQ